MRSCAGTSVRTEKNRPDAGAMCWGYRSQPCGGLTRAIMSASTNASWRDMSFVVQASTDEETDPRSLDLDAPWDGPRHQLESFREWRAIRIWHNI